MVAEYPPESEITLTVVRDKEEKKIDVELISRSEFEENGRAPRDRKGQEGPSSDTVMGMKLAELTPSLARKLGVDPSLEGVAVLEVKAGSRAGRAGLRPGDVILRINHKRIGSMKEMKEAVKENKNRPMLIRVKRQDSSLFLVLPP